MHRQLLSIFVIVPNNTMSIEQPTLRVRKDHTCLSLGLIGLDNSHIYYKFDYFQRHTAGMEGQKPGKSVVPKMWKPWFIGNWITKHNPFRIVEKKKKAIGILKLYNYKLQDDDINKNTKSRLISTNFMETWKPTVAKYPHKTKFLSNHHLFLRIIQFWLAKQILVSNQPAHHVIIHNNLIRLLKHHLFLRKILCLTIKTNTSARPVTLPTMSTILSELHPRKYKRVEEMESEWCVVSRKLLI